ncbi:GNAT family N-acetyltransferase [Cohnella nanjingensis]|uniref:GNAT family N-acetyltransferase n=1 Tax=Cohnella nanjingensis TaxID=1387779 RepID=A0A7X0RL62_9BACL|nr:GNAT family N-acetyltransferase [Cohnella nanjingensis]MBB6669497.1 GNAT family N-acetyltransferase [Cohnella nanjingensis]
MDVRAAKDSDYPELRKIFLASRRVHFHWADPAGMALEDFDRQTVDEFILLAEEQGRILGFAALYLPDNFIHHLFVHPDAMGMGVGGRLLAAAVEKMSPPIRLKCVSENRNALNFYVRKGWKQVVEEEQRGEKYWIMEYEF